MMLIKIILVIGAFVYLLIINFRDDKIEKHITITIYKDDNPKAARSIWVTLSGGILNMTEQDIGPLVERTFGNSCYERYLSNISAKAVRKAVKADADDVLLDKLKVMFGTNSGFDDFAEFLRNNKIYCEYGSY